jgi:hypothetical protein
MRRSRVLIVVLLVLTTMGAIVARSRTITLQPRLLRCLAPPDDAVGEWAFAFLELHNPGRQVVVMDHETLQAAVRTLDNELSTSVELWLAPRDPQGTWFHPGKGVQLRMRLPPDAKRVVLRTYVRRLTRRESLEAPATRSGTRRLLAGLYGLVWIRLPNEPRWEAAMFELDLDDAKTRTAGEDGRITRPSSEREPADSPTEKKNVSGGWLPSLTSLRSPIPQP